MLTLAASWATSSMRSSLSRAFTRLWACLALLALALKRSMNRSAWRIWACWFSKAPFWIGVALLFFLQVVGVVAGVGHQLAAGDFDGGIGGAVEEGPVVAHDDDGALVAGQVVFNPLDGGQVQVVGRFVEQQQGGLLEQDFSQHHAHAPAAGEGLQRLFDSSSVVKPRPSRISSALACMV
jgi:hypothetical protein